MPNKYPQKNNRLTVTCPHGRILLLTDHLEEYKRTGHTVEFDMNFDCTTPDDFGRSCKEADIQLKRETSCQHHTHYWYPCICGGERALDEDIDHLYLHIVFGSTDLTDTIRAMKTLNSLIEGKEATDVE